MLPSNKNGNPPKVKTWKTTHTKLESNFSQKKISQKLPRYKRQTRFTQGEPYELYFRITNIGTNPTPETTISDFKLRSKTDNVSITSKNSLLIKPLNPNESIETSIDLATITFKGAAWVIIKIAPVNPELTITTFQYDVLHNKDDSYDGENGTWGNLIYIQGELEIAQQKTNTLILILTTVTVIEAVFGMKNTLLALAKIAYYPLSQLSSLLGSFIK